MAGLCLKRNFASEEKVGEHQCSNILNFNIYQKSKSRILSVLDICISILHVNYSQCCFDADVLLEFLFNLKMLYFCGGVNID